MIYEDKDDQIVIGSSPEAEKVREHTSNARWKICDKLEVFSIIQNYMLLLEDYLKNFLENI